ncbi:MAG: hypothetical protein ACI307_09480 [Sodaliphilus sp.]
MSLPVVACHNRPSEAHCFGCGYLQTALQASPSLASYPQYAISDGRFAASPPEEKAASRKNCGYYKQDWIVFVDQWVDCFFGCFT